MCSMTNDAIQIQFSNAIIQVKQYKQNDVIKFTLKHFLSCMSKYNHVDRYASSCVYLGPEQLKRRHNSVHDISLFA